MVITVTGSADFQPERSALVALRGRHLGRFELPLRLFYERFVPSIAPRLRSSR